MGFNSGFKGLTVLLMGQTCIYYSVLNPTGTSSTSRQKPKITHLWVHF